MIINQSCDQFYEGPYIAGLYIVTQVFANGKGAVDNKYYMQGRWVTFDPVTINQIYKLPIY